MPLPTVGGGALTALAHLIGNRAMAAVAGQLASVPAGLSTSNRRVTSPGLPGGRVGQAVLARQSHPVSAQTATSAPASEFDDPEAINANPQFMIRGGHGSEAVLRRFLRQASDPSTPPPDQVWWTSPTFTVWYLDGIEGIAQLPDPRRCEAMWELYYYNTYRGRQAAQDIAFAAGLIEHSVASARLPLDLPGARLVAVGRARAQAPAEQAPVDANPAVRPRPAASAAPAEPAVVANEPARAPVRSPHAEGPPVGAAAPAIHWVLPPGGIPGLSEAEGQVLIDVLNGYPYRAVLPQQAGRGTAVQDREAQLARTGGPVVVVQRSNRFTVYRGRTAYHVIDHGGIVARYGRESQDHPVTPGDQLVPLDAVLGVQGGRITVRRAALPSSSVPIDPPGGWPGFGDD